MKMIGRADFQRFPYDVHPHVVPNSLASSEHAERRDMNAFPHPGWLGLEIDLAKYCYFSRLKKVVYEFAYVSCF